MSFEFPGGKIAGGDPKAFPFPRLNTLQNGPGCEGPESGRTYTACMRLEDRNTLRLRGYVMGMRFLGRIT